MTDTATVFIGNTVEYDGKECVCRGDSWGKVNGTSTSRCCDIKREQYYEVAGTGYCCDKTNSDKDPKKASELCCFAAHLVTTQYSKYTMSTIKNLLKYENGICECKIGYDETLKRCCDSTTEVFSNGHCCPKGQTFNATANACCADANTSQACCYALHLDNNAAYSSFNMNTI